MTNLHVAVVAVTLSLVSGCSNAASGSCDVESLRKLKSVSTVGLRVVKKFAEDPKGSPYLEPYQRSYFEGGRLKVLELQNSSEYGFTDHKFWVLSDNSFLAEKRESWYGQPIDPKVGPKVVQKLGNLFFVCDGKTVRVESLDGFAQFPDPGDHLNGLNEALREGKKQD